MSRMPVIYMVDVHKVIVYSDKELETVMEVSDFFVEDTQGAYDYAKKHKYALVVKCTHLFTTEGK